MHSDFSSMANAFRGLVIVKVNRQASIVAVCFMLNFFSRNKNQVKTAPLHTSFFHSIFRPTRNYTNTEIIHRKEVYMWNKVNGFQDVC